MGFRCLLVIGCLCLALMANAAPAPAVPQAQLDVQQREWLAQHSELRVGLVLQAPYAQYDRRLQRLSGANVELMQWLAKALNIELTWRNFPNQEQLEAAVLDGEVDIAPGLQQTPAGLRLWLFTDPYMRVPQRIVGIREGVAPWSWRSSMSNLVSPCACRVPWPITCAARIQASTCKACPWNARLCSCW